MSHAITIVGENGRSLSVRLNAGFEDGYGPYRNPGDGSVTWHTPSGDKYYDYWAGASVHAVAAGASISMGKCFFLIGDLRGVYDVLADAAVGIRREATFESLEPWLKLQVSCRLTGVISIYVEVSDIDNDVHLEFPLTTDPATVTRALTEYVAGLPVWGDPENARKK